MEMESGRNEKPLSAHDLRVHYVTNPLGLDEQAPGMSWRLKAEGRGCKQTAYRIMVARSPEALKPGQADVWDSGKILSDQSVQVSYEGPKFESETRYYWTVSVWDQAGRQGEYVEPAWFETGLLTPEDWEAEWISAFSDPGKDLTPKPAPHFRKRFETKSSIASARLYIAGLGYYEAYLNGHRVGDRVLDPAATHYDETVLYATYDITDALKVGRNAIGVILGTGWYNMHTLAAWDFEYASWRAQPSLKAKLVVTYDDGSKTVIRTDASWSTRTGPIVFDGVHNGETYDARFELKGWSTADTVDEGWEAAHVVSGPGGKLKSQLMPPIRSTEILEVDSVTEPKPGLWMYQFARNISGWVRLIVSGPEGSEIVLRHGERLYEDGTLDQEELSRFVFSGETQTCRYILGENQPSEWAPRFTYHGFQYVEVTVPEGVTIHELKAEVLHTDFKHVGTFSCSNPLLNQIHEAMRASYLGNYHGYPTDCPHREKIGWSGDAHLIVGGGLYNFDTITAYLKWIDDFVDEQRPTGQIPSIIPTSGWGYSVGSPPWEGAFIIIPWHLFLHTGDRTILERYFEPMKRYLLYLEQHLDPDNTLSLGMDDHKALTWTGPEILSTGYYYSLSLLLVRMALELNNPGDAEYFKGLAEKIRLGFRSRFYDQDLGTWGNGSQASLACVLYHGLAGSQEIPEIMDQLLAKIAEQDYHFDAGVIGVQHIIEVLTRYGQAETVYRLAAEKTYPSLGYWMEQGATTLWQNWDGTQSRNHIMFGSIDEWFYKTLVGIQPDNESPGFQSIVISPSFIEELDWVAGSYESCYGKISSEWRRSDGEIELNVSIPANTSARIHMPSSHPSLVMEGRILVEAVESVDLLSSNDNEVVVAVGAGNYSFRVGVEALGCQESSALEEN